MKNWNEILKAKGVEVPEDKVAEIDKEIAAQYKTVAEVERKLAKQAELQKAVDERDGQIAELAEKIKALEASGGEVEGLKQKVAEYEAAEQKRKDEAQKAAETEALKARFNPLRGEHEFVNAGTERWIFDEFQKALGEDANKGKSDAEVYASITKDKDIYRNPNQQYSSPGASSAKSRDEENAVRSIMGLPPLKGE